MTGEWRGNLNPEGSAASREAALGSYQGALHMIDDLVLQIEGLRRVREIDAYEIDMLTEQRNATHMEMVLLRTKLKESR